MSKRTNRKRSRKSKSQSLARRGTGSVAKTNQSVGVTNQSSRVTSITHSWSAPIPSPATLREFEMVVPGLAERIVRKTELQSEHRMKMESTVIGGDSKRSYIGLVFAFILSLAIIASGTYIAIVVHPWAGSSVIGTGVAGLAGVFVYGTNSRRRERERKESIHRRD